MINRRTKRIAAIAIGLSLIAAACGDDDDDDAGGETATEAAPETSAAPETTTAPEETSAPAPTEAPGTTTAETEDTSAPASDAAMSVTYTLSDAAVWSDGSPMSWEDFECTWLASINTPETISTQGYDQIGSVTAGATEKEVVVNYNAPFAAWRTLFVPILQASQHADCNDVTAEFPGGGPFPYGNNVYIMTEWTPEQIVFEVNPEYVGPKVPKTPKIVVVPAEDGPTLLKAGTVDFIYQQSYTGMDQELADPNVEFAAEGGGSYEGFYFNQWEDCTPDETRSCAFADDVFREAFSKSIDVDAVYQQIYAPFAQGLPRLECGPVAPGPYCDPVFTDTYDPEGAATLLEGAGWTQNADGFWQNADGEVPEIHWMVSSPNPRRESTQAFLIPQLTAAGFNVIADNCEALPCVFEVRLPSMSYDFTMYINTVSPDPVYITGNFACDYIPTEENEFAGQNNTGYCNQETTDELFTADATLDEAERITLVKSAISNLVTDHVMLPLLQFPNVGAFRIDKVAGTQNNLAAYWAFQDWENFEDVDGDGQVVIGAEQFPTPDCTNPITSCANSSWYQWVAGFQQWLGPYVATNDQTFQPTEFLEGEAVVTTAEG